MKELAQQVITSIPNGRAMLSIEAATQLMEVVAHAEGDYIEIGSAYGGSAIMAGMAMKEVNRLGTVYCISPFSDNVPEIEGKDSRLEEFWANVHAFHVEHRIIPFKQRHPPFPAPLYYHKFSVGLVDGDHSFYGAAADIKALASRITDYLLIDNLEKRGVRDARIFAVIEGFLEQDPIEYTSQYDNKTKIFGTFRRISHEVA